MTIHSPACENYLGELLTAPTGSVEHGMAEFLGNVTESVARDYLIAVIDEDHGTRPAEIALQIWHLAADTTEREGAAMTTPLDSLRLMHYQAEPLAFDPLRVYTQRGQGSFTKPVGFWVSIEGPSDWPAWCLSEEFAVASLAVAHEVRLLTSAHLRLITSVAEIDGFHEEFAAPSDFDRRVQSDRGHWGIDWSAVAQRYDGVIIAPYLWERRHDCDWYYGWDCASGCVWNLSAIESVTVSAEAVQR